MTDTNSQSKLTTVNDVLAEIKRLFPSSPKWDMMVKSACVESELLKCCTPTQTCEIMGIPIWSYETDEQAFAAALILKEKGKKVLYVTDRQLEAAKEK